MLHEPSPALPLVTRHARQPLYSGATLVVIVVCLVLGSTCLLFTDQLMAVGQRLTRPAPAADHINSNPNLSDDQRLMYTLTHVGRDKAVAAVRTVVSRNDKRFIPVLIEMLEANESRVPVHGAGTHEHVEALETLAGENFRDEAAASMQLAPFWIRWYESTSLMPPRGFIGWKGALLSRYNPRYKGLLRDGSPVAVRVEEIHFGGRRGANRASLDHPDAVPAGEVRFLTATDLVYGVRVNGQPRAYPARVVDWHRVINDEIDGIPLALTFCPQTGSTVCYDVRDGQDSAYHFATTGLVYRGNELLSDKATSSLWCQISGECAVGKPAATNARLRTIPVVLTSWKEWLDEHPATRVAVPDIPFSQLDGANNSNSGSSASNLRGTSSTSSNGAASRTLRIYGLTAGDLSSASKAYPLESLANEKVVNDTVGNSPVVLVATNGTLTAERRQRRGNSNTSRYVVGAEVRAYRRSTQVFHPASDSEAVVDEAGRRWEITEEALVGPENQQIPRINGIQSSWLGWQAFHPGTELSDHTR